ncbi:MAG: NACHT domain-containing protein [Chloroflexi bacterium]|nr:NACHT domain-containing protein [Chloroflexota bacterium]
MAKSFSSGSVTSGGDLHARDIITGIQQHFTVIFAQPFQPPADLAQLRRDYLAYLTQCYRHLDMRGIQQVQRVTEQLELTSVYVPLKAITRQAGPGEWLGRIAGRWQRPPGQSELEPELAAIRPPEPVPIEAALKSDPAVVALGDPGAGKSTLLKVLALALAEQDSGPLPILLPLNAYASRLQQGRVSLSHFLGDYYAERQQRLQRVGELFEAALAERQAVVLLDGLDETQASRADLVRLIEDFAAERMPAPAADPAVLVPGNRIIVTSRFVGYEEAPLAGQRHVVRGTNPVRLEMRRHSDKVHDLEGNMGPAVRRTPGG